MNPNECWRVRSQMQIARSHLHRPLQIGSDHTAVLLRRRPARLLNQPPQHRHMFRRQKLLLFHQIQSRHFRVGRRHHPHLIRLLGLDPALLQTGRQNVVVISRAHRFVQSIPCFPISINRNQPFPLTAQPICG